LTTLLVLKALIFAVHLRSQDMMRQEMAISKPNKPLEKKAVKQHRTTQKVRRCEHNTQPFSLETARNWLERDQGRALMMKIHLMMSTNVILIQHVVKSLMHQ